MKTNITKIITILSIVLSNFTFGQTQEYIRYANSNLRKPINSGFFYYEMPNNIEPGKMYQNYKLESNDTYNDMVLTKSHVDSMIGYTHYKYQQTYKGLPVEGAGCIEHFNETGSLNFINAKIADSINKSPIPSISPEDAIDYLIQNIQIEYEGLGLQFAWQDTAWQAQIQSDKGDSTATWYPEPKLIWALDNFKDVKLIIAGNRYTLAYKIPITIISPDNDSKIYYVDAQTGEVLKTSPTHISITADVYGYGTQWLDANWRGGFIQKYELNTDNNGHKVHTKKFVSGTWNNMPEVRKHAGYWGSEYLAETSAHFHVSNSWDYFRNTFGQSGFDSLGTKIRVITQFPQYNAFFNYNNFPNELVFGKSPSGYSYAYEPSVVGHEFTHGITYHSAGLEYEYEPGALNESYSDIFGTVIQSLTLENTYTDWIIGNKMPTSYKNSRSLVDPNSRGTHWEGQYDGNGNPIYELGQPDYYLGTYWCNCPDTVDAGGVHINSGVQNKWFQVLTDGNSSVQGIGMKKAANIAYLALTTVLMKSAQYSDSKEATIEMAIEEYGLCSAAHKATVDAWNYVGVYASYDCNATSVKEYETNDISVYPNPTSGKLTIELPHELQDLIQVYDITGKQVKELKGDGVFFKADLSGLEEGMYFLHFDFGNQTIVKRIIVQ